MARWIVLLLALTVAAVGIANGLLFASRDAIKTSGDVLNVGAPVLLARGRGGGLAWELFGRRSDTGPCIEIRDSAGGRTLGCGFGVPGRHALGFLIHRTKEGRQLIAAGPVVGEAVKVRLLLAGGERVETTPAAPLVDSDMRAFVADLSAKPPLLAVEALGRDGAVLGRRGLDLDEAGTPITTDH